MLRSLTRTGGSAPSGRPVRRTPYWVRMLDRGGLVRQMAKAFVGEDVLDPLAPDEETRRRAEEALARVELYLGVDVQEAKEIVTRVLEDVA